jgi:hypothetical protein
MSLLIDQAFTQWSLTPSPPNASNIFKIAKFLKSGLIGMPK